MYKIFVASVWAAEPNDASISEQYGALQRFVNQHPQMRFTLPSKVFMLTYFTTHKNQLNREMETIQDAKLLAGLFMNEIPLWSSREKVVLIALECLLTCAEVICSPSIAVVKVGNALNVVCGKVIRAFYSCCGCRAVSS